MGIERMACDLCGQLVALTEEHGAMDCIRFLKEDVKFYRRREKYWVSVLGVSDGGTYRTDWDSRIRKVVEERKRALEEREALVELVVDIVGACMKLGAKEPAVFNRIVELFGSRAEVVGGLKDKKKSEGSFSPAKVKEVRERTGAKLLDCKSALVESDGDVEKAIEIVQKTGLAKGS